MNRGAVVAAALAVTALVGGVARADTPEEPAPPAPYSDPPFECEVTDYGTEAPPESSPEDPLCVRYDKSNITIETLEFIEFLEGEPTRITMVAGKCSYWQQDHWVVRLTPDSVPLIEWEGSYWYDARTGTAAGAMRGLKVNGEKADGVAFIEALRPLIGNEQADELLPYTDPDGGGGATFSMPEGFSYPDCGGAEAQPADPPAASNSSAVSARLLGRAV